MSNFIHVLVRHSNSSSFTQPCMNPHVLCKHRAVPRILHFSIHDPLQNKIRLQTPYGQSLLLCVQCLALVMHVSTTVTRHSPIIATVPKFTAST